MAEGSPTEKRAAHLGPERRRPQVLDAALRLFLKSGYEGTSMDAVAKAAGVTKPVVYACFDSKDELFRSLLAREEERILGEVQGAFEGADLTDPDQTLVNGFTGFLRGVDKDPAVYRLIFFGEGGGNAAVAERVAAGREQQVEALAESGARAGSRPRAAPSRARHQRQRAADGSCDGRARGVRRAPSALGRRRLDPRLARPRVGTPRGDRAALGLVPRSSLTAFLSNIRLGPNATSDAKCRGSGSDPRGRGRRLPGARRPR